MQADLSKLRKLCEGNKNYNEIAKSIESLHDRQDFAYYHYHEFLRLSENKTEKEALLLALSVDNKERNIRMAINANIMACIHNIHITHDLLAWLVFNILELNIQKNHVSFRKIITTLKELNSPNYSELLNLLYQFAGEDKKSQPLYYDYLCDLSNHSKHRQVIKIDTRTTFQPTIGRTSHFEEFLHNNKVHQKMNVKYIINSEYNREAKLIIQIENELINILEKRFNQY